MKTKNINELKINLLNNQNYVLWYDMKKKYIKNYDNDSYSVEEFWPLIIWLIGLGLAILFSALLNNYLTLIFVGLFFIAISIFIIIIGILYKGITLYKRKNKKYIIIRERMEKKMREADYYLLKK